MPLKIKNPAEFRKLLSALVEELVDAQIHFTLYQDLAASSAEYFIEFSQSNPVGNIIARGIPNEAAGHRLASHHSTRKLLETAYEIIESVGFDPYFSEVYEWFEEVNQTLNGFDKRPASNATTSADTGTSNADS